MRANQIVQSPQIRRSLGRPRFKGIGGGAQRGRKASQQKRRRIGGRLRNRTGPHARAPALAPRPTAQAVGADPRGSRQFGQGLAGAPTRGEIRIGGHGTFSQCEEASPARDPPKRLRAPMQKAPKGGEAGRKLHIAQSGSYAAKSVRAVVHKICGFRLHMRRRPKTEALLKRPVCAL